MYKTISNIEHISGEMTDKNTDTDLSKKLSITELPAEPKPKRKRATKATTTTADTTPDNAEIKPKQKRLTSTKRKTTKKIDKSDSTAVQSPLTECVTPQTDTPNIDTTPTAAADFISFSKAVSYGLEVTPMHLVYYSVLEQFALGRIKKLIVTMPPQHGKSHGATVLLPAYILGLNPDLRLAIASYSSSLATKFNRRIQRIIESKEYGEIFPNTTIKTGTKPANYIRTSDEFDILYREGSLLSVGREGSLTGNRVDCFILDDLYKNAMEANSPLVRENCVEWYTSVVKTRMHNTSQEMMVFTRWHEEDLIGVLTGREPFEIFTSMEQIETLAPATWLYLNFEAIKSTPPSLFDPRAIGEALWPERQNIDILLSKRALDPLRFECMYQGNPTTKEGLLYGDNFKEYEQLPSAKLRHCNYTDTADMGDDYLCSICYATNNDELIYITDVVYTREPMEVSEPLVAGMLQYNSVSLATIESNNGGRGFARSVQKLAPEVKVEWFHQSANKQARILSNSATVVHRVRFPPNWQQRWPDLAAHLTTYRRQYRSNRWHDAADVLTGIIEREQSHSRKGRQSVSFF